MIGGARSKHGGDEIDVCVQSFEMKAWKGRGTTWEA